MNSTTGTRTRVARVKAEYPSQLDYSGSESRHFCSILKDSSIFIIQKSLQYKPKKLRHRSLHFLLGGGVIKDPLDLVHGVVYCTSVPSIFLHEHTLLLNFYMISVAFTFLCSLS